MDFSKQLVTVCKALEANFMLNDRPISYEQVLADTGLMPSLARRADQLCNLCLGYGLGITFDEVEGSTLGVKVIFDDVTPNALRILCITDVISELIESGPSKAKTPLDELMYD